jgi:hypothetical protein
MRTFASSEFVDGLSILARAFPEFESLFSHGDTVRLPKNPRALTRLLSHLYSGKKMPEGFSMTVVEGTMARPTSCVVRFQNKLEIGFKGSTGDYIFWYKKKLPTVIVYPEGLVDF